MERGALGGEESVRLTGIEAKWYSTGECVVRGGHLEKADVPSTRWTMVSSAIDGHRIPREEGSLMRFQLNSLTRAFLLGAARSI